jgi:aminoglycoside phosphotransferase (APT) family kinase protein
VSASAASLSPAELDLIAGVLDRAGAGPRGPLTASLIAGGKSNLTFRLTDGVSAWVMRTPPRAGRTPSAHDVAREFRVTSALSGTGVPVARAVALEEDEDLIGGPFAIAEFVAGRTIQTRAQLDELDDATVDAVVGSLVAVLAALHAVDPVAVGLERLGRFDAYAERQLKRWAAQWELVARPGLLERGSGVARRLRERIPPQRSAGIVHGDYRIDNTLLAFNPASPPRVAAVVDWELSTIGDPVADVAMMCAYREPAFDLITGAPSAWTSPRLPEVATLAGRYESVGGVRLQDFEFHLALAYFKVAAIAAGIDYRLHAGAVSGDGFATAGDSVPVYLDLAERFLGGTHSPIARLDHRSRAGDDPRAPA